MLSLSLGRDAEVTEVARFFNYTYNHCLDRCWLTPFSPESRRILEPANGTRGTRRAHRNFRSTAIAGRCNTHVPRSFHPRHAGHRWLIYRQVSGDQTMKLLFHRPTYSACSRVITIHRHRGLYRFLGKFWHWWGIPPASCRTHIASQRWGKLLLFRWNTTDTKKPQTLGTDWGTVSLHDRPITELVGVSALQESSKWCNSEFEILTIRIK